MANYSIFRVGKIKSATQARASQEHCSRTRPTRNADPERTHLNRQLLGDLETLGETLEFVLHQAEQKRKIMDNANLLCEGMLGASPEWFRDGDLQNPINPQRVEEFVERAVNFIQGEFGDSCLSASLHLDETTPHIHFHFVPLHRGTKKHPEGGWLSWEDWFGGRQKMQAWQDSVASYMEPIGLQRGVKGSFATHEDMTTFYAAIQQDITTPAPDLEREFALPQPEPGEATATYHQRLTEHFAQALPAVQDNLKVLEAHARSEAVTKRRAKDTANRLQALVDELDEQKQQLAQQAALNQQLKGTAAQAIAAELLAIAEFVLTARRVNYYHDPESGFTLSRRRGFTKIDKDGKRLAHNENGQITLTEHWQQEHTEQLREARQLYSAQIAKKIEPEKNKSQQATGGGR